MRKVETWSPTLEEGEVPAEEEEEPVSPLNTAILWGNRNLFRFYYSKGSTSHISFLSLLYLGWHSLVASPSPEARITPSPLIFAALIEESCLSPCLPISTSSFLLLIHLLAPATDEKL